MAGPHIILVHGALGDASQMAPLAARLRDGGVGDGATIDAVELEGHGATPARERPFRIEYFAENVLEHLERRGLDRADLFGYSMGGYVALHLAATAAARVRRVATLATKLAWTQEVAAREMAMLDPATIRAKVPRFAEALERRHSASGAETVLRLTADLLGSLGGRPLLGPDVFATISHPVRLAVGDRDATVGLDETAVAARALPNGELEVYPRTPHPFEKVSLERLTSSLREFFG